MIKLEKGPVPQVLDANFEAWTEALMTKVDAGIKPTDTEKSRYRHKDIKQALLEETNKKCAYCESLLLHVHHGDVEHIYPKSLAPNLSFEWSNLTLACEICNQNKSNKDPHLTHIIDPYDVPPEDHIFFVGALAIPKGSVVGQSTIVLIDLNRPDLIEIRLDRMSKLAAIFQQVNNQSLPLIVRRAIWHDLITNETSARAPYAAMARSVVSEFERQSDPELVAAE